MAAARQLTVVRAEEPAPAMAVQRGDTVVAKARRWLWEGRVPADAFCITEGDAGSGKSTYLAALAAGVTDPRAGLGQADRLARNVLWASAEEDSGSDVIPRIVAAGGDASRVFTADDEGGGSGWRFSLAGNARRLSAWVGENGVGLIVIDPLWSYLGAVAGSRDESEIRAVLDPLAAMCREHCCCLMAVRQLRKDRTGPAITHGMGHTTYGAVARSILLVERPNVLKPERYLRPVKVSGGGKPQALLWHMEVRGGSTVFMRDRDLSDAEDLDAGGDADAGERGPRADARRLLRERLATERVSFKKIAEEAEAAGVSLRTLNRAKDELGVQSHRVHDSDTPFWEWGPPKNGWVGTHPDTVATLVSLADAPEKAAKKPRKSGKKGKDTKNDTVTG